MRSLAAAFAADDPARLAGFWAGLLDRPAVETGGGVLLPGGAGQLDLRCFPGGAAAAGPNRMHVHLTSAAPGDQARTVAAALALGATHLDVGQRPDEGHVVLADPEGNPFCVIEPGNAFLAGCGFLGELACDGTRAVGVFWSEALGWPLVWDRDEETAIQAPYGGTKVAWGGPPVTPVGSGREQRFEVTATGVDRRAELDRLVALGATHVGTDADGDVLTDTDGAPFLLRVT